MVPRQTNRQGPRVRSEQVLLSDRDAPELGPWPVYDIGMGGIASAPGPDWQTDSIRRVRLTLGELAIDIPMRVRRVTSDGLALTFESMDRAATRALRTMQQHLAEQGAGIDERRRAPRSAADFGIAEWSAEDGDGSGLVLELSATGALLQTDARPPVESSISIRLRADDSPVIACRAQIVRHLEDGFIIEFQGIKTAERAAISRLCVSRKVDWQEKS